MGILQNDYEYNSLISYIPTLICWGQKSLATLFLTIAYLKKDGMPMFFLGKPNWPAVELPTKWRSFTWGCGDARHWLVASTPKIFIVNGRSSWVESWKLKVCLRTSQINTVNTDQNYGCQPPVGPQLAPPLTPQCLAKMAMGMWSTPPIHLSNNQLIVLDKYPIVVIHLLVYPISKKYISWLIHTKNQLNVLLEPTTFFWTAESTNAPWLHRWSRGPADCGNTSLAPKKFQRPQEIWRFIQRNRYESSTPKKLWINQKSMITIDKVWMCVLLCLKFQPS